MSELFGDGVFEGDCDLRRTLFERINGELKVFMSIASDIKGVGSRDEKRRIFVVNSPGDLESLRRLKPVGEWENLSVILLGFHDDIEGGTRSWRRCLAE